MVVFMLEIVVQMGEKISYSYGNQVINTLIESEKINNSIDLFLTTPIARDKIISLNILNHIDILSLYESNDCSKL